MLYGAWHVEAFARVKRLPPLERILRPSRQKAAMSQDQIAAVARTWKARLAAAPTRHP